MLIRLKACEVTLHQGYGDSSERGRYRAIQGNDGIRSSDRERKLEHDSDQEVHGDRIRVSEERHAHRVEQYVSDDSRVWRGVAKT